MPAFATGLTVAVTQVKSHHRITVIHQLQAAYQLDHLPAQQEVLAIAEKWRPYRRLATSYLFSAAFRPGRVTRPSCHRRPRGQHASRMNEPVSSDPGDAGSPARRPPWPHGPGSCLWYTIRIHGHLGAMMLSAFPAMVPQRHGAETVLTGLLDRSALYGVLAEIEALGLDLLEVRQLEPDCGSPEPGDGRSQ